MVQEATRTDAGVVAANARQLAEQFTSQVQKLRSVVGVVALSLPDGLSVWVMMDGDSTGRTRRSIYDAEYELRRRYPDASLEFRVIDAAEFPPERRTTLLPDEAETLFQRQPRVNTLRHAVAQEGHAG